MSFLTEDAQTTVERIAPWAFFAAMVYVTYALACHIGWRDSVAANFAFWFVLRAHRLSGSGNV